MTPMNRLFLYLSLSKGDVSIFHASSFHILLQTSFGLQIQIQHVPVMQVYVSLEQSYRAKTKGIYFNLSYMKQRDKHHANKQKSKQYT